MRYLRCRTGRKAGCPWRIEDESYDSLGQLLEHERECAVFIGPYYDARYIADALASERVAHLIHRHRIDGRLVA